MKILKILGLVVGVHIAAFMFVFAIPGCRSTVRQSPSRSAEPAAPPPSVTYPSSGGSTTSSLLNDPAPTGQDTLNLGAPISPGADTFGTPAVHFNPTRPGTSVAVALKTAPVADVTPATAYTVGSGDNLWKVAKKHGITLKELAAANNLHTDSTLKSGQKLIIPGKSTTTPQGVSTPPASSSQTASAETMNYKVKAGESLAQIAKRSGTTVATIKSLNHLSGDSVRAGQELVLPAGGSSAVTLASTVEPERTASLSSKASIANGTKYVVRAGESLNQIAKRFGVSIREIAAANHISDPQKLRAGQELVIPGGSTKGAGKSTTASTTPAAPATVPPAEPASPISASQEQSPVTAPAAADAPPPVVKVEDSSDSPVAPVKN